jgi:hypothetical protein
VITNVAGAALAAPEKPAVSVGVPVIVPLLLVATANESPGT